MRARVVFMMLLGVSAVAPVVWADDACTDFKWDVAKERALFAKAPAVLQAGTDIKTAPTVVPDTFYQIQLASQSSVRFVVEPGRKSRGDSDHGGVATLKLPAGGSYRIALDAPMWIDVVSNGTLVPAKDFQGQHDCSAPHKIVEFELTGNQPLILQLSSSATDSVRLTVTSSPARKL
jgi:hypothetical protein